MVRDGDELVANPISEAIASIVHAADIDINTLRFGFVDTFRSSLITEMAASERSDGVKRTKAGIYLVTCASC